MKSIKLLHYQHEGKRKIGLEFGDDVELARIVIELGGFYSRTKCCWYLENNPDSLKKLFHHFKGVAWIDGRAFFGKQKPPGEKQRDRNGLPTLRKALSNDMAQFRTWMFHRNYSPNTISSYVDCVSTFFRYHEDLMPALVRKEHIVAFNTEYILRWKFSISYQNQFINGLKLFLIEVHKSEIPLSDLERPRRERRLPNVLSKEEVKAILRSTYNSKHRLILSFAYASGLRMGEVINLRISDIDRDRKVVTIKRSKGFKDRVIPLPKNIDNALDDYLSAYRSTTYLFEGNSVGTPYTASSIQKVIKRSTSLAGINKPVTLHWLRHSYATHLMESGTDSRYIQKLLGHNSIKTTEIYTHVSNYQLQNIISPFDEMKL